MVQQVFVSAGLAVVDKERGVWMPRQDRNKRGIERQMKNQGWKSSIMGTWRCANPEYKWYPPQLTPPPDSIVRGKVTPVYVARENSNGDYLAVCWYDNSKQTMRDFENLGYRIVNKKDFA